MLGQLLQDKDPAKAKRAMQAMLQMDKIDIAALKQAAGWGTRLHAESDPDRLDLPARRRGLGAVEVSGRHGQGSVVARRGSILSRLLRAVGCRRAGRSAASR